MDLIRAFEGILFGSLTSQERFTNSGIAEARMRMGLHDFRYLNMGDLPNARGQFQKALALDADDKMAKKVRGPSSTCVTLFRSLNLSIYVFTTGTSLKWLCLSTDYQIVYYTRRKRYAGIPSLHSAGREFRPAWCYNKGSRG